MNLRSLLTTGLVALLAVPTSAEVRCPATPRSQTTCSASSATATAGVGCGCGSGVAFGFHATLSILLTAYWPLDEASGDRADVVGSNDLTDSNTVTSVSVTPPPNFPTGIAASFAAATSESLIKTGQTAFSTSLPRATSFWFRTTDVTQVKGIISVGEVPQSGVPQWFFRLNGSHLSVYAGIDGGGAHDYTDGTTVLSNNTWYFVVMNYNHPGWEVYLNNVLEISDTDGRDGASQRSDNLYFGVGFPGFMNLNLAQVGAWSRALSFQERFDLYANGSGLFYDN